MDRGPVVQRAQFAIENTQTGIELPDGARHVPGNHPIPPLDQLLFQARARQVDGAALPRLARFASGVLCVNRARARLQPRSQDSHALARGNGSGHRGPRNDQARSRDAEATVNRQPEIARSRSWGAVARGVPQMRLESRDPLAGDRAHRKDGRAR